MAFEKTGNIEDGKTPVVSRPLTDAARPVDEPRDKPVTSIYDDDLVKRASAAASKPKS